MTSHPGIDPLPVVFSKSPLETPSAPAERDGASFTIGSASSATEIRTSSNQTVPGPMAPILSLTAVHPSLGTIRAVTVCQSFVPRTPNRSAST